MKNQLLCEYVCVSVCVCIIVVSFHIPPSNSLWKTTPEFRTVLVADLEIMVRV